MSQTLRDAATAVAVDYGFSSLQEVIRVILKKFAKREMTLTVEEKVEYLTPDQEAILAEREAEFLRDKAKGKTYTAHSVKELMEQLNS